MVKRLRFRCVACSGLLLFFMATGAMGTAPRLSPDFFEGHENKIVIFVHQAPAAPAGSMVPLLEEIVNEALKTFDKDILFEIYPSKTLIQHLLDKQNGLAVIGQVKNFPDSPPGRYIVLPCYTAGDVQIAIIINSENPESDTVHKTYQDGYKLMINNGRYHDIIQRHHR